MLDLTFTDDNFEVHHNLYKKLEDFLSPDLDTKPETARPQVEPEENVRYIDATINVEGSSIWRKYKSLQELRDVCGRISRRERTGR